MSRLHPYRHVSRENNERELFSAPKSQIVTSPEIEGDNRTLPPPLDVAAVTSPAVTQNADHPPLGVVPPVNSVVPQSRPNLRWRRQPTRRRSAQLTILQLDMALRRPQALLHNIPPLHCARQHRRRAARCRSVALIAPDAEEGAQANFGPGRYG